MVIHQGLKDWIIRNYPTEEIDFNDLDQVKNYFEKSPYYKSCASDLTVSQRIKTQAVVQAYISHSISSTVNLPKETTVETIDKIFREAYAQKLKGITIYRDGCRTGILNKVDSSNEEFPQYSAPKRPKDLKAQVHILKSKGKSYAVFVGLMDNKPYEVFAAEYNEPIEVKTGIITKVRKHVYKWTGDDGFTIANIRILTTSLEEKACTLYISMLLRHGAKVKHVIKTARKVDDNIVSFTSAICRVLTTYLPKDDLATEEVCPECGEKLVREAGCIICKNCSYSVCLVTVKADKDSLYKRLKKSLGFA